MKHFTFPFSVAFALSLFTVNSALALNETDEATKVLVEMKLSEKPANEIESATKYFDDILKTYGYDFDWRAAAGLS